MAAITWADVVLIAPELAAPTVPTASQNAILAQVVLQMNVDAWGDKLNLGSVWLAAHIATIGLRRAGNAGPVTSESVGSVSRTFAASIAAGAAMLGSTSYGLEYERILLQLPAVRFDVA